MHRLVAFGCSNTYGEALENPQEQAWPSVLAEMLNYECVNLSYPGSSPRYVIYKMQKFNFRKTDIVVVLWPEVSRYCCIQEDDSVKHIGIWYYSKDKTTKNAMMVSIGRLANILTHLLYFSAMLSNKYSPVLSVSPPDRAELR